MPLSHASVPVQALGRRAVADSRAARHIAEAAWIALFTTVAGEVGRWAVDHARDAVEKRQRAARKAARLRRRSGRDTRLRKGDLPDER